MINNDQKCIYCGGWDVVIVTYFNNGETIEYGCNECGLGFEIEHGKEVK